MGWRSIGWKVSTWMHPPSPEAEGYLEIVRKRMAAAAKGLPAR